MTSTTELAYTILMVCTFRLWGPPGWVDYSARRSVGKKRCRLRYPRNCPVNNCQTASHASTDGSSGHRLTSDFSLKGKLLSVLKSSKDLLTWTLVRYSRLITHHEQGNNEAKLKCKKVQLDCTKYSFTNDVVREWNKLSPSVVQCDTINLFKNKLDHHLLNQDIR